jgi:hypothetical protein
MTAIDPIAALHESGHAVVAACAGYGIREVVLHPIGSRPDEAGHCLLQSDWEAELRADSMSHGLKSRRSRWFMRPGLGGNNSVGQTEGCGSGRRPRSARKTIQQTAKRDFRCVAAARNIGRRARALPVGRWL